MIDLQGAGNKGLNARQPRARFLVRSTLAASLLFGAASTQAKTVYVNGAISKPGTGATWATAYRYLRDALDHTTSADVIYVAKGTYYPDDGASGNFGDREESFELDGQRVYGGFAGTESTLSQRNPQANPTVLSGAIWDQEDEFDFWSLHVVRATDHSTLDGFTVENGHADGSESWNYPSLNANDGGGGCYVLAGKVLTLANCAFRNNYAYSFGGAIMVEDGSGKVVADNCVFENNRILPIYQSTTGTPAGGAIKGSIIAKRCKFINNMVSSWNFHDGTISIASGGAVAGDVTATDCVFTGNSAIGGGSTNVIPKASGGAVSGNLRAIRCTFSSNRSSAKGAGEDGEGKSSGGAVSDGSIVAMNCAFVGNTSGLGEVLEDGTGAGGGGAVYVSKGKSIIANCVFVNNSSEVRGGAICVGTTNFADSLVLANSTFLDNGVSTGFWGSALSCGGIVRMLDNIFWYTAELTDSVTRGDQVHVMKNGTLRNSLLNYPDPSTMAPNIVRKPAVINPAGGNLRLDEHNGVTVDVLGDIFLGSMSSTILSGDPKFANIADPDGPDNLWATADDGLRIQTGGAAMGIVRDPRIPSPVAQLPNDPLDIDQDGDVQEFLPTDMIGVARVQNSIVELGAYEFGNLHNLPEISISASTTLLTDGGSYSFGNVGKGTVLKKDFTITNLGTTGLNIVSYSLTNTKAFILQKPFVGSLKPGASAKFSINFKPSGKGKQTSILRIVSNDLDEGTFDINLSGTGTIKKVIKKKDKKSAVLAAAQPGLFFVSPLEGANSSAPAVTTTTADDGSKYLVLTVRKSAASLKTPTVEVSSDLLAWFSGPAHTTTLVDTATILSVRDNTPVSQGEKRYIRLK